MHIHHLIHMPVFEQRIVLIYHLPEQCKYTPRKNDERREIELLRYDRHGQRDNAEHHHHL